MKVLQCKPSVFTGDSTTLIWFNKLCRIFVDLKETDMIVVSRLFFYYDYVGLTLWPFIILREKRFISDHALINHERIHLRQQRELLILPFYLLYLSEWLIRSIAYMDSYKAYRNLSFEREAYQNEGDLNYLDTRKPLSFLRHL
jgi:hypothetical protein